MAGTKIKNILIYRLGSLGDTVIALPCFNKIRNVFPEADITLLTNRPVMAKAAPLEAVLGKGLFFDRVIDYPVGTRNLRVLSSILSQIRDLEIDTVINLSAARTRMSTFRDNIFFRAAGVKNLIGFPKHKSDFLLVLDPATGLYEWEAKRLARRINDFGPIALDDEAYWDLRFTDDELDKAHQVLGNNSGNTPTLAISLGTKVEANDWTIENWLALISKLGAKLTGWKLVVIGAADEAIKGDHCLEAWGKNGLNLCGQSSPRVSAAVLKKADIFIGHDSGPLHLAACVGTPCIGIFSARNLPGRWFPKGNQNKIIYHKTDCAGCGLEICIQQKKKCILSITVEEVYQGVLELFEKKMQNNSNQITEFYKAIPDK